MVVVHMNVCAQVSVPGSSGFLPSSQHNSCILYFYTVEVQSRARCRFKVLHQRSYPGTCINLLPSNYLQTGYIHVYLAFATAAAAFYFAKAWKKPQHHHSQIRPGREHHP